jgi:hypothetical protein
MSPYLARPLAFGMLLSLGLGACSPPPPPRHDWHYKEGFEALLHLGQANLNSLQDLKAEAKITLIQDGKKDTGTALILFKQPDWLRVEVRGGPLYSHVFTVLSQGDSVTVLRRRMAPVKGAASGPLLAHLTGMDLGFFDFRYTLMGLVEPGRVRQSPPPQYPRADRAIVVLQGEPYLRRIWVDLFSGLISREEILGYDGEYVLLVRELNDYQRVEGMILPRRVDIHQGDTSIALEYRSYVANSGLEDKSFLRGIRDEEVERLNY